MENFYYYLLFGIAIGILLIACRNFISDLFYAFLPESKKDKELRAKCADYLLRKQSERSMESVWISSLSNSLPSYIDGGTIIPTKDDFVNALLHQKDQKIQELEQAIKAHVKTEN